MQNISPGETAGLQAEIDRLNPWWENINFSDEVRTGPGRNKHILWRDYLSPHLPPADFFQKSILDMGCNAGGNLIELSSFHPSRLVGIDANPLFISQAEFVRHWFSLDCDIRQYKFQPQKSHADYQSDLGYFDVIFCLGIIYHLDRKTNLELLTYIRLNSARSILSTQIFNTDKRAKVDWDVSREGTLSLVRDAGFSDIRDIHNKSDTDNWSGLTNQWYFELIW